jgi:hypothetical protein
LRQADSQRLPNDICPAEFRDFDAFAYLGIKLIADLHLGQRFHIDLNLTSFHRQSSRTAFRTPPLQNLNASSLALD